MGLLEKLVVATLPAVPRPIMRRLSSRYIAGETLGEAVARLRGVAESGFAGVLDVLGEDVSRESEARAAAAEYLCGIQAIADEGLDCYVSVKPTHFGLRLSEDLAFDLYAELLARAQALGQFVRVEMEDKTTTDATLRLFARLFERFGESVGIVLQSRLFRTLDDLETLPPGVDVRMVKGVYLEPESVAHTDPQAIRDAFLECTERLVARGHRIAVASHDEHLTGRVLRLFKDKGLPEERFYFEVLLGVCEPLWDRWRDAGHLVRVYVPYGPEWRSYSQRRLQKNPQILRHVLRNTLRR